ncbi:MAG: nucleotidyl transferase AbiEii/AbiGii toxin family protein [Psychrosphaera sp.]|nr:nucleotidyl transferase AbiEii/AbiGii toxin family protein [Psychrosphaera sp.]
MPQFDAPKLRAYPSYTVIAKKFHALTTLGIANSLMKDYFDLSILSQHACFEGEILQQAIQATFQRRQTPQLEQTPFGLTVAFANDTQKRTQWQAFIRKNRLDAAPALGDVIAIFLTFVMCLFSKFQPVSKHDFVAKFIEPTTLYIKTA